MKIKPQKTYPRWESIPRDNFDGSIPELAEKYAIHCVNAYPRMLELIRKYNKLVPQKEASGLLKILGEHE
jgi:hypothetical protein